MNEVPTPYRAGAVLAATAVLAAGCAFGDPRPRPDDSPPPPAPAASEETSPLAPVQEVVAAGLAVPWDVDFLPDGAALVTERTTGRLLRVGPEPDGDRLRVTEVQTIEVEPTGEGGLLGLAVSPEYESDQTVFVYYTTPTDNRVARLVPGRPPEPVLTGIPRSGNHNGGQLAFGPDGYLYVSTGDAAEPPRSQDLDSLAGKILRMTPEGEPAPDNPFDSLVWAYGVRNVQGLAWDAAGNLWATEFGASEWDEINLIEPGGNYGWPEVEGVGGDERFVDPVVVWPTSEASCSGAAVTGPTLVVACLRGQRLYAMELTGSGAILGRPEPTLVETYGRLRGVTVAPDGSLWVTTSNRDGRLPGDPHPDDDRIIRLLGGGGGTEGVGRS